MQVIDNINHLLGDDLKKVMGSGAQVRIAASCFSIYAFEVLKTELSTIDGLHFLFTSPTFLPNQVTDKLKKERREFHLPKLRRENSLYGTEFEIRLKNELTQKAIAIAVPAREGEPLAELVERESRIRQLQRQLKQLENKLASEKQFNRKVAINTEIRGLHVELIRLRE